MSGEVLSLHLWRRLDWRFLLPPLQPAGVLCAGEVDDELRAALALWSPRVHEVTAPAGWDRGAGPFDVAVLVRPRPADLDRAVAAVRPGGWVYAEVRRSSPRARGPHTLPGWRRAYRAAGLEELAASWHAPDLAASTRIIALGARLPLHDALMRHQGLRFGRLLSLGGRLALRLGLFPLAAAEGSVVGRRPEAAGGARRSWAANQVERVLHERYDELALAQAGVGRHPETALLTPRFTTSRHVVALVYSRGDARPRLVVKVPRRPGDDEGVRREAAVLRQLAALAGRPLPGVPRVLGTPDVGGVAVLVETAVHGDVLDPPRVARDLTGAVGAGMAFVEALPVTRPAQDNSDWYERAVTRPLRELAARVPLGEVAALCERTHALLGPLRGEPLPAVFEHGDLSHPNLLLRDGALQVVDWERATPAGVPGHDLVFLLQHLSESSRAAFTRPAQCDAFDDAFCGQDAWARSALAGHLERRGVHRRLTTAMTVLCWARSAATLVDRLGRDLGEPGPGGSGGRTAVAADAVAAAVTEDRDVVLWRHALERAEGAGAAA